MKYVLAVIESAFCVVAAYIATALVLFGTSANATVPGFMTARTTSGDGRLDTSLSFHPVGGLVLFVVLTALFASMHGRRSRRSPARARQEHLAGSVPR